MQIHACANTHMCKYTCMPKYTHVHRANIHMYKYTHVQIHKYTHVQIYVHAQIHACASCKYTHVQIYTTLPPSDGRCLWEREQKAWNNLGCSGYKQSFRLCRARCSALTTRVLLRCVWTGAGLDEIVFGRTLAIRQVSKFKVKHTTSGYRSPTRLLSRAIPFLHLRIYTGKRDSKQCAVSSICRRYAAILWDLNGQFLRRSRHHRTMLRGCRALVFAKWHAAQRKQVGCSCSLDPSTVAQVAERSSHPHRRLRYQGIQLSSQPWCGFGRQADF